MWLCFLALMWSGLGDVSWQIANDDLPEYWTWPTATVSPQGRIYVADRAAKRITLLDAEGNLLRIIGGSGEGPGLFQGLSTITYWPDSDTLVVMDHRSMTLSFFSSSGEYRNRRDVWSGFDRSSLWIEPNHVVFDAAPREQKMDRGGAKLALTTLPQSVKGDTNPPTDVTVFLKMNATESEPYNTVQNDTGILSFPWETRPVMAASPDQKFVVVGSTLNIDLTIVAVQTGETLGRIDDPQKRQPLEKEDTQIDNIVMTVNSKRYTARDFSHGDYWPAVENVYIGADNRIWVLIRDEDESTDQYKVYDHQGALLGSLQTPVHWQWVHADSDHLWLLGPNPKTEDNHLRKQAYTLD